jgi:hypothetical protein
MITPLLYDSVELLVDLPEQNLRAGMQGAIVHQYDDQTFEVELVGHQGETIALCALSLPQFIVVWQAKTEQPVPIIDQVAQVVARLPETPQLQLLDFARFLSLHSAKT